MLQPAPATSRDAYLYYASTLTNCANYGAEPRLFAGTDAAAIYRPVLHFDLRDIPAGATVTSSMLSLFQQYTGPPSPNTVGVHRLTTDWTEGTGNAADGAAECTGDGATWYDATAGVQWKTAGGDIDPTPAASLAKPAGEPAGWDDFDITSTVRQWANGEAPNNGVLVRFANEALVSGNYVVYQSGDGTAAASLRPKLAVTYADQSHAQGPVVNVSQPAPAARVAGTAVSLAAGASDDRRVESVVFLVDGAVVATDTAAPYSANWNSTGVANGAHTVTARATDDAGNITVSSGTAVTVDNTAAPATAVTAPANNATVSGAAVSITANATDDRAVTRVEFYADDQRIGEDTTAPYAMSWNTLDAAQPYFDGAHTVTAKAYDDSNQVTTSALVNLTVANTVATQYKATFAPSAAPQAMTYDPALGTQETYGFNVTVTNKSSTLWRSADIKLYYQWYAPDWVPGTPATITSAGLNLAANVRAGKSTTFTNIGVVPPSLPQGADRAQWKLRFDLFDVASNAFFAAKGNGPADNPIIVNKVISTGLGLERWWHYQGTEAGVGMDHLVNVASGNSILRWSPFSAPGRGLSTSVDLTYNSLEQRSESPAGNNFSLSISGLTRLGNPLDIHPNNADTVAGRSNK